MSYRWLFPRNKQNKYSAKPVLYVTFFIFLILLMMRIGVSQANAEGGEVCLKDDQGNSLVDNLANPFCKNECTYYAYSQADISIKRLIKWSKGVTFDNYPEPPKTAVSWMAGMWPKNIKKYGPLMDPSLDWDSSVNNTVEIGAILVIKAGTPEISLFGKEYVPTQDHVAYVSFIGNDKDGEYIHIKEINGIQKDMFGERDIRTSPKFIYIHTPQIKEPVVIEDSFSVYFIPQVLQVSSASKFELYLDGQKILASERPESWRDFGTQPIFMMPFIKHHLLLKWWNLSNDLSPVFKHYWRLVSPAHAAGVESTKPSSGDTGSGSANPSLSTQPSLPPVSTPKVVPGSTIPNPPPTQVPVTVGTPALSSPGNGASLPQSTDITLRWNSTSNATQYKVELWGGLYSTMTPCDWQSGTSCHIGQMWPGTMSWHVKARNGSGQESSWSDTWNFTIQDIPATSISPTAIPPTQPPTVGKPSLSSPGNGSSMAQNTDITLSWNSTSNATQYKVELWGGPYSTMTPCDWQSGTSCHIGQMWPGTMSWHVKARNGSGQESSWSDTWNFTIQDIPATSIPPTAIPPTQPPTVGKPSLSSPGNGSSMAQNTDITLSWNSSSNATQYKVELWGGPYSTMTPCDWQSGTSCHIGQMWPGTMSWHVKARNGSGQESSWSDTWNFTIQDIPATSIPPTQPPSWKPSLSSPGNGSGWPQSTDITLSWNSLSGATQYKVELWGGPYSLMTPCNWQNGSSCHIGQMWPGTMHWHVLARDSTGKESSWSDEWTFTINN